MADEPQYSSDSTPNKRKYDDQTTPPSSGPRRPTGFSSAPPMATPDSAAPPAYNNVPPPVDDFQAAKRRAEQIAARLLNSAPAEAKRPRVENGSGGYDSSDKGFSSPPTDVKPSPIPSSIPTSYGGFQGGGGIGTSKKIEIPNMRVGVIIGKGGETIKYLQLQSGAKIQVTRDTEADLNSPCRMVELMGTAEQISKAEQLINDVLAEAETGGSGIVGRRVTGQPGSDNFVMKIPNNKVGLVIGKGGETIKNMQASTGARIQVIPLHLPPGDTSQERTVQIDGTSEQIESAKLLVNEVISENRLRNPSMGGGYSQQGYQTRPPTSWSTPGAPQMQQPGYGYVQPGAYPGQASQYNMSQPPYAGYPSQPTSGGYAANWDQTSATAGQQTTQGSGYDYYNQQPSSQQQQAPGGTAAPADNTGYNYNQQAASGYNQQGQGYTQDGYGGYAQSGYGQPAAYDQQQGYNSAGSYGNVANSTQEGHTAAYGAQGDPTQAPSAVQPSAVGQQGYGTGQQPSPNPASYPAQGATQPGYGTPQSGYGNQTVAQGGYPSYGAPTAQKPGNPPVYGQPQQSPSTAGGYGQPGYAQSQPPASGYAQPDSATTQRAPPSSYGAPAASQPGYGAVSYGQPGYGQGPASYNSYAGGYAPPVYSADGSAAPASQAVQPSGVSKSPQS